MVNIDGDERMEIIALIKCKIVQHKSPQKNSNTRGFLLQLFHYKRHIES